MKKRRTLFEGYVVETDLFGNRKRRRLTVKEARDATRLWMKHADIRTGTAQYNVCRDALTGV